MRILIGLLILIPAIEIGLFLVSSNLIGVFSTLLLIVITGIIGAYLAKKQGLEVLRQAQYEAQSGRPPTESILDGLCVLIGGLLLLTPGFLTDTLGFILLIPALRAPFKSFFKKLLRKLAARGQFIIFR